jgi:hypothetical protein
LKDAERDKKRVQRDFESLKSQLLLKEQGVKSELERVWADWEERCGELEGEKRDLEYRLGEAEGRVREVGK